ncbi:MAG TPA: 4Fe-4S ferredoxin, partial [bacterium]
MNNKIWQKLLKPSTRSFFQEGKKISNYSFWDWLHGYVYSRWPYFYISVGTGEHRLSRIITPLWKIASKTFHFESNGKNDGKKVSFADTYHGKVVPLEEAKRLVTINKSIDIGDLEQVIPYSRARDIVLLNPDHIAVLECPCRASRSNPCEPLDVCLIIGEPFAGFIVEHHPRRARWISQQEAMTILTAEHQRGHV